MTATLAVIPTTIAITELADLERAIDTADEQVRNGFVAGVVARWRSGRIMVAARVGKRLPNGSLDDFTRETGKSRRELQYRMTLADEYSSEDELCNALHSFGSWRELVKSLTKPKPDPDDQSDDPADDDLDDFEVPELTEEDLARRASGRELRRLTDLASAFHGDFVS